MSRSCWHTSKWLQELVSATPPPQKKPKPNIRPGLTLRCDQSIWPDARRMAGCACLAVIRVEKKARRRRTRARRKVQIANSHFSCRQDASMPGFQCWLVVMTCGTSEGFDLVDTWSTSAGDYLVHSINFWDVTQAGGIYLHA